MNKCYYCGGRGCPECNTRTTITPAGHEYVEGSGAGLNKGATWVHAGPASRRRAYHQEVIEALKDRETRIQAWLNGSWDDDVEEDDDMDAAVYWGSRAGGKMLAVRDEFHTYADPEYAKQFEKINLDNMLKTFNEILTRNLERKLKADAEVLSPWDIKPERVIYIPANTLRAGSVYGMDFGSQTLGQYDLKLRSINDVAQRKRSLEMLHGVFTEDTED